MSTLPVNFLDLDPNHTPAHNATNTQVNINSRPATVAASTHSSSGVKVIDANNGHVHRVTVSANITGFTFNNMVIGLPFLLILEGNGAAAFTANLSGFQKNSTTALTNSQAIQPDSVLHISFVKDLNANLWCPAGIVSYIVGGGGGGGGSGISFIASSVLAYTGGYNTSWQYAIPASVQSGDLIEVIAPTAETVAADPGAPTTPSGYTQRWTNTPPSDYRARQNKYYKIANGSEGGTNLTITWGSSVRADGGVVVWRGVDNTTPYDVAAPAFSSSGSNPDPPSVTTVTNNAVVTTYVAGNYPGGSLHTPPAGYNSILNSDNIDRSLVVSMKLVPIAGLEDPGAYTWLRDNALTRTDSLRPAP